MKTQSQSRGTNSPRPRKRKDMLARAIAYAESSKKGVKISSISAKSGENEVTVYKLIRLGNAPKRVISMIENGEVPATTAANALKASMSKSEQIRTIEAISNERKEARKEMFDAGFKGAKSMTVRRSISLALNNLKSRSLIKSSNQKAIVTVLRDLLLTGGKPSVQEVENAVLAH